MGKKHKCPEFENHERWLVSYADMLTLLFAVFVVLFALKEGGEPAVQRAAGALQESFNIPLDDIPVDRQGGPSSPGFGIFEHMKATQIREPINKSFPSHLHRPKVIDEDAAKVRIALEERLYGPKNFRERKKTGEARIVQVDRTAQGFKLRLVARHFYNKGSYKLRKSALKELDEVILILKKLGRPITIEGHTDSLPPKTKNLSNWDLSTLRATYLIKYMVQEHGFPRTRLSGAGYADTKPIAHNGTKAGRRINRRVEFQVHYE